MNNDIKQIWEVYSDQTPLTDAHTSDDWSGGASATDYEFCKQLELNCYALEAELKQLKASVNHSGPTGRRLTVHTDAVLNSFAKFKRDAILGRHQL